MHREKLIEGRGVDDVVSRLGQLEPHERGFDASDEEENQAGSDVHHRQLFVINGDCPLHHQFPEATARRRPGEGCETGMS